MITYLTILPDLSSLAGSLLLSPNRRSHVRCGHSAQKRSTGFPSTVDSAFKLTCITTYLLSYHHVCYVGILCMCMLMCLYVSHKYVYVCILSMLWVLFLFSSQLLKAEFTCCWESRSHTQGFRKRHNLFAYMDQPCLSNEHPLIRPPAHRKA